MQANRKNIVKKVIDVCMTILLLCLMAYQVTGEKLHEWGGIAMTVLLIVHHILNYKWYRSLFKGKYTAYRIVTVIVNTLLLASIALTALCGMAMSSHAVPFLYGMFPVSFARRFHLAISFWSFILMGLHLGLHIPAMTAGFKWSGKVSFAAAAAAAVVSGIGLWLFVKNGIPDYIFFRTPFAFFDYDKSAVLVFLENIAILTAFAFLGAEAASFIKAGQSKGKAKRSRLFISSILVFAALLIGAVLILCTAQKNNAVPSWSDQLPPDVDQTSDNFVLLEGGKFMMGSPESENWRIDDETRHEVTVSAFYIDPYETTQKDYARVTGENPSSFTGDELPVESVSWLDAIIFANAKSAAFTICTATSTSGAGTITANTIRTAPSIRRARRPARATFIAEGAGTISARTCAAPTARQDNRI